MSNNKKATTKSSKKVLALLLALIMVFCMIQLIPSVNAYAASDVPTIKYRAHCQNIGWQNWVTNGNLSGTEGQGIPMEALQIKLTSGGASMIEYCAHVTNIGWQKWVDSGKTAGTTGQALPMQAIKIRLKGDYAKKYDIYYRAHIQNYGWLGWAKNGGNAGSTSCNLALEGLQIVLVNKGTAVKASGTAYYSRPSLTYQAHCADIGWQDAVKEGKKAGTTGESRRMEALIVNLKNFKGKNGIKVRAHCADHGWMDWVSSGEIAGTTGEGRQLEAIKIKLDDNKLETL